jgi:hypothetical protein
LDLIERRGPTIRRHPWETARLEAIKLILRRAGLQKPNVLEMGCGDAFVLTELHRSLSFATSQGYDPQLTDELAQELAEPGVLLTNDLGRLSGPVQLVLLLDVIEHVEDPLTFLRQLLGERLAPDGWVLVTAPAFQSLFTQHDRYVRHFRRYTRREIVALVTAANMHVDDSGYLFSSLLLPRALDVLAERWNPAREPKKNPGIGDWQGSKLLTSALHRALLWDGRLGMAAGRLGVQLPGLSVWAMCRNLPASADPR